MTGQVLIVSRHFLRRRARAKALTLNIVDPIGSYTVQRAVRGPYRWYVVKRT